MGTKNVSMAKKKALLGTRRDEPKKTSYIIHYKRHIIKKWSPPFINRLGLLEIEIYYISYCPIKGKYQSIFINFGVISI